MSSNNGTRAKSLAAQFKQKAESARRAIDLPVPLVGDPDFKFSCVVRRIDIVALATSEEVGLPEHFVHSILNLKQPEKTGEIENRQKAVTEEALERFTLEDLKAVQKFQRKVAQETCLEPRIVFGPTDDEDAINLEDPAFAHCRDEVIAALYNYGMRLSPDVPVKTAGGGETTLQAVEKFRDKRALLDAGDDGTDVQLPAVGAAGN